MAAMPLFSSVLLFDVRGGIRRAQTPSPAPVSSPVTVPVRAATPRPRVHFSDTFQVGEIPYENVNHPIAENPELAQVRLAGAGKQRWKHTGNYGSNFAGYPEYSAAAAKAARDIPARFEARVLQRGLEARRGALISPSEAAELRNAPWIPDLPESKTTIRAQTPLPERVASPVAMPDRAATPGPRVRFTQTPAEVRKIPLDARYTIAENPELAESRLAGAATRRRHSERHKAGWRGRPDESAAAAEEARDVSTRFEDVVRADRRGPLEVEELRMEPWTSERQESRMPSPMQTTVRAQTPSPGRVASPVVMPDRAATPGPRVRFTQTPAEVRKIPLDARYTIAENPELAESRLAGAATRRRHSEQHKAGWRGRPDESAAAAEEARDVSTRFEDVVRADRRGPSEVEELRMEPWISEMVDPE